LLVDFSTFNLVFERDSLDQGVRLIKTTRLDSVERYSLMTGRSSSVNDPFQQLTIYLKEIHLQPEIKIEVRAFDDGPAGHLFPKSVETLLLIREQSAFAEVHWYTPWCSGLFCLAWRKLHRAY
jgi:hypothetical protein